jgi:hypothetical protein
MSNPTDDFVAHVKKELKEANGIVRLAKTKYVKTPLRCCGYFSHDPDVEIAVAMYNPMNKWISTLCHEFSHFEQWKSDCAAWRKAFTVDGGDHGSIMDEWLMGKDYDTKTITNVIHSMRRLELDCERRTIKNIEKFNLPIDLEEYCREANTYIHFHNYVLATRKWYKTDKCPYNIPEILDKMPSRLDGRYDRTPKWLIDLYVKYCQQ